MVHVGGINPVLANINASPIVNVDLGATTSLMIHPPGQGAPDADYTSTAIVYGTHPTMTTPPQPLFTYSTTPPGSGTPVSTVTSTSRGPPNVTWKYNPATTLPALLQRTTPDMLADGVQNAAANVVVQYVQISYGPWAENSEGGLEVQADLYPNASGTAVVFRNGMAFTGHLAPLHASGSPTQFVNAFGVPIPLQPGQTWVELVPNTIIATTTP